MSIVAWWPRLRQRSRDHLMDNNGDVVPPALVDEIVRAGGIVRTDAWWVGQSGPTGLLLSDEAIDWIDEVANGETPEPRQTRQSNILNCRPPLTRSWREGLAGMDEPLGFVVVRLAGEPDSHPSALAPTAQRIAASSLAASTRGRGWSC